MHYRSDFRRETQTRYCILTLSASYATGKVLYFTLYALKALLISNGRKVLTHYFSKVPVNLACYYSRYLLRSPARNLSLVR